MRYRIIMAIDVIFDSVSRFDGNLYFSKYLQKL